MTNKLNIALICVIFAFCLLLTGCADNRESLNTSAIDDYPSDESGLSSTTVSEEQQSALPTGTDVKFSDEAENFTKNDTENGGAAPDENGNSEADKNAKSGFDKFTVVIDPGHGGTFAGASYDGRTEKNLTLKLAEYVKNELNFLHPELNVFLTREDDSTMSSDVVKDLELRCEFGKEKNADILVSLHFNASENHNQTGACVYVSRRSNANETGTLFGEKILNELSGLGIKNNGVQTRKSNDMMDETGDPYDYYAINRHASNRNYPAIIVEHCFMDNNSDILFIDSDEDLMALAAADAAGIIEALKVFGEK